MSGAQPTSAPPAASRAIPDSPRYQDLMGQSRRLATEFVRQNADGTIDAEIGSHLELALASLIELGASDAQLQRFHDDYRTRYPFETLLAPRATIRTELWQRYLGNRRLEPEFRRYFAERVTRDGAEAVLRDVLPVLVEGIGASAFHALIRTMLGWVRTDDVEIAEGLGYWAATYLRLGRSPGAAAISRRPADLLTRMRDDATFRAMDHFGISLWRRIEALGLEPHFAPVIDWLAVDDAALARLARDSLALYIHSNNTPALHAVTSCQALRELLPLMGRADQHKAVRHLWQAIAALYGLMGFLTPLTDAELDKLRALPCPSWPVIEAAACASLDEHDIKLTFVCRREAQAMANRSTSWPRHAG
ncbi:MAG: questin oxidase family protein [Pseudomonadota bacterium]